MLQQTTQRRICRGLFLLACVLPTLGLGAWSLWRMRPSHQVQQLAWLEDALGVRIECRRVQTPRPGQVVFHDVSLRDTETRLPLATIDCVRLNCKQEHAQAAIGVVTLDPQHLPRLAEAVRLSLRRQSVAHRAIPIDQIVLGDHAWRGAVLSFGYNDGGERTLALSEAAAGGAKLHLARNRAIDPPETRLVLSAGSTPMPWRLLAGLTPLPAELGPQARLQGELTLLCETRVGELTGQLSGVDLAQLAPHESQLALAGPATLTQVRLAWRGRRFHDIDLTVTAPGGVVAWWLPHAAHYYLGCQPTGTLHGALQQACTDGGYRQAPFGFDRLAFRLRVDSSGVRINGPRGDLDTDPRNAIVTRGDEPLMLRPPTGPAAPVESLLQLAKSPRVASPEFCPHARALSERLPISSELTRRR